MIQITCDFACDMAQIKEAGNVAGVMQETLDRYHSFLLRDGRAWLPYFVQT